MGNNDVQSAPVGSVAQECKADLSDPDIAIICVAICACADVALKQACVDAALADPRFGTGGVYHDSRYPNIHVQVPFDMDKRPPQAMMSDSQTSNYHTDAKGNARALPKPYPGFWLFGRKRGSTRIPDVILTKDPHLPPTGGNIKRVVEIKFPPDRWRAGQYEAYSEIDPTRDPLSLSPECCRCPQKPKVPVDVPVPALKPSDYLAIAGLLILAGVVILDPVPGDEPALAPIGAALGQYGLQFSH